MAIREDGAIGTTIAPFFEPLPEQISFGSKADMDKADRILIRTDEELQALLDWGDAYEEARGDDVKEFQFALEEAVISYLNDRVLIYYVKIGDYVVVQVAHQMQVSFKFYWDMMVGSVHKIWVDDAFERQLIEDQGDTVDEFIGHALRWIVMIMTYMTHFQMEKERITRTEVTRTVNKKRHNGKKTKTTKKMGRIILTPPTGEELAALYKPQTTGRKYERHAESWHVRGHKRVYKKTGKEIWVKPQVRGNKKVKPERNTYTM